MRPTYAGYRQLDPMNELIASLSDALFWDIDKSSLHPEKHALFITERVLTRGNLEEFLSLKKHYGRLRLGEIATSIRCLDIRTLHFCSVYFNIPLEKFRCYNYEPSNPAHWNY